MELIILGLLMLKNQTIYEIKKYIEEKFTSISSNSTGSIQSAIKKLLNNGMIIYDEFVENSVNKKMYGLTDKGKVYFIESVSKPMQYKEKNMEFGKLFFMGFAPSNVRIDLISNYIAQLKKERTKLEEVRISIQNSDTDVEDYINYLDTSGTTKSFMKMLNSESLVEGIRDIALFQYATLEFAIDKVDFEIRWFEQLKKRLEDKNE